MHKAAIKQIKNIQTYKIQNIIRWQTVQTQTKQRTFTWSVEISSAQIPYLLQTAICSLIDRLVAKRCTSTCELACNLCQKSIRLWFVMCDRHPFTIVQQRLNRLSPVTVENFSAYIVPHNVQFITLI